MDNQRKGRIAVQTRYGERHKQRRQNLILNSLIAVVFILIIVVGANLLKGPSNKNDVNVATTGDEIKQEDSHKEQKQEDLQSEGTDDEDEGEDTQSDYNFSGGGPDGPWEPIGTKQTGEHVVQYKQDTLDWEEMEMALAYGAGIDRENMTVIWIGNGGSPQRAKGQVKDDHEQNKIYHVTIEWIDEQGWKPIQVEVEES